MNFIIVRTKLQAVIAGEMIGQGVIKKPFVFLPVFQFHEEEDDLSVRNLYRTISDLASWTVPMHQLNGLFLNSAILFLFSIYASLSRGNIYVAGITSYALAIALKLNVFARIRTFDDGMANIQVRISHYHAEDPLPGSGIKRNLSRLFFPRGAARFCRSRIIRHYTIYPNHENIVEKTKVEAIHVDWMKLLSESDIQNLKFPVNIVMLGTVYREHEPAKWKKAYQWAIAQCDLYLPHPREKSRPDKSINVLECSAPAEAVINYLLQEKSNNITILHFNCSAVMGFLGDDRVRCIDLLEKHFD